MKSALRVAKREFLDIKFARFLVFGTTGAVVNLVVGSILYAGDNTETLMPYWVAITIASFCSMAVSFSLNFFFNFQFKDRSFLAQFKTYLLFSLIGLVLVVAMAEGLLRLTGLVFTGDGFMVGPWMITYKFASHFCSVGSIALYSFIVNKYISFNVGIRGRLAQLKNARNASRSPGDDQEDANSRV